MPKNKSQLRIVARSAPGKIPAFPAATHPAVSLRWLLTAIALSLAAAIFCAWASLGLLFWQGSWQLLYHPQAQITRTPADAGLAYDPVGFAVTETGQLRLHGWWIPAAPGAPFRRFTVLYLHGADGNLSDTVDALASLHAAGVNVFAFDYRGYGQSQFVHPSELTWRQDADWALAYLTATRHIAARAIVLDGDRLGADLALEVAAAHPELAGVVLDSPLENPAGIIFNDPRARLVPAHELVDDRYDMPAAASALRVPSLWFLPVNGSSPGKEPEAFQKDSSRKMLAWLKPGQNTGKEFEDALSRWLGELQN